MRRAPVLAVMPPVGFAPPSGTLSVPISPRVPVRRAVRPVRRVRSIERERPRRSPEGQPVPVSRSPANIRPTREGAQPFAVSGQPRRRTCCAPGQPVPVSRSPALSPSKVRNRSPCPGNLSAGRAAPLGDSSGVSRSPANVRPTRAPKMSAQGANVYRLISTANGLTIR